MIERLKVKNFRNIQALDVSWAPRINLIVGENGCGKTSLLEAIYLLGNGKSFRTNRLDHLVGEGGTGTVLFGTVHHHDKTTGIGFQRTEGSAEFRVQGEKQNRRSVLAENFPTLAITPASHEFLEAGPQVRRKYLDWGVFHVEPQFGSSWSAYQKALKQRSALLQWDVNNPQLDSWEVLLGEKAAQLDAMRRDYLCALMPYLGHYATALLPNMGLRFTYEPGQPADTALSPLLKASRQRDRAVGYAQYGPHRGDVSVHSNSRKAAERVSRGQQKLIIYVFILAQIKLLQDKAQKAVSLLLDDLGAELDRERLNLLFELLKGEFSQVFITSTDPQALQRQMFPDSALFHVEHGRLVSTQRF